MNCNYTNRNAVTELYRIGRSLQLTELGSSGSSKRPRPHLFCRGWQNGHAAGLLFRSRSALASFVCARLKQLEDKLVDEDGIAEKQGK